MEQYYEFILLGILLIIFYRKPKFIENIQSNKVFILLFILLNAYVAKTLGTSCGIIMALILIAILDNKEGFSVKEGFSPKLQVWRPDKFVGPCQVDLDRKIKEEGELANINASKQLNGQTNDGFKQKQLY